MITLFEATCTCDRRDELRLCNVGLGEKLAIGILRSPQDPDGPAQWLSVHMTYDTAAALRDAIDRVVAGPLGTLAIAAATTGVSDG